MAFELPPLPYEKNALAPHISPETLDFHYDKHHRTYVTNLNNLVAGTTFEHQSLEEVVMASEGGMLNNAAQVWNHTFYWHCLSPQGGGEPEGALADAINSRFGSFEAFSTEFTKAAVGTFGSGWAWLVRNSAGNLEIMSTSNADLPMRHGKHALLTCDVWEHAYYIDYRNARPQYLAAFWQLVNWAFVSENFTRAEAAATAS